MGFIDDAKKKYEDVEDSANETADKVSKDLDIAKQRVEGEIDKAKGHKVKGEVKIQASKVREKLNQ